MNLFIREMRAHRRSLVLWCIGMLAMVGSGMGKYAGMATAGQSMTAVLESLPKSLQSIFGVGVFDLTTAIGFYAVLHLYLAIMAAVHAAMLGADIIAKEERDKTAEFLLVKPVSRNMIIGGKLLAGLANLAVLNLVTLAGSIAMVGNYSAGQAVAGDIARLMAGLFALQLVFFFIGTGIAAIDRNPKTAASIATAVLMAAFFMSVAADISSNLGALRYLTPFAYYSAKNIMVEGVDVIFGFLTAVIIGAMAAATCVLYRKRDMNI